MRPRLTYTRLLHLYWLGLMSLGTQDFFWAGPITRTGGKSLTALLSLAFSATQAPATEVKEAAAVRTS